MTLLHPKVEPTYISEPDTEVLIREARRLRRRRWMIGFLLLALVVGAGIGVAVVVGSPGSSTPATRSTSHVIRGGLPDGPSATLASAGPLAVAPNGALYVADISHEQVLVRLANGRFRVVAGDGKKGTTGDGGPAVDAEFLDISDLVVAPNGSLYIVDGTRVRVVGPNGTISTVAGVPGMINPATEGNRRPPSPIANGTPAHSVSIDQINSPAITLSEQGELYISTGLQLLRLANGKLDVITTKAIDPPYDGQPLNNLGEIAVDAHDDLYVSGGNGWSIWRVAPNGTATVVTNSGARRSGGNVSVLERAPDGLVYGEDGSTFLKLQGNQPVPTYSFPSSQRSYFYLAYFAFGPGGTIYADEVQGNRGLEKYQQLRSVHNDNSPVLWQQTPADIAEASS